MPERDIDRLLQHSGWVRALAASLVRDPGLADDLVQEMWISALRRDPSGIRSPRAWLATLLLRRLREAQRRERRRERHETLALEESEELTTDERVELAESQRLLTRAVLELREPFRTTVLLRYLQELAPGEIAERMGVPVPTVHSRLARGLASLRARLSRPRRSDRGVLSLLAVRWRRALRARGTPRRLALRLAPRRLLSAGVLVVGLSFLGLSLRTHAPGSAPTPPHAEALSVASRGLPARSALEPLRPRTPSEAPVAGRAPLPEEPALPAPVPPLRGRVLDCDGVAVGGVRIAVVGPRDEAERAIAAVSASDGTFTLPRPETPLVLGARDARCVTVMEGRFTPGREAEVAVFVAPRIEVKGHVRDESGAPIAEAEVFVDVGRLNVTYDRSLFFNQLVTRATRSDARGAFRLPDVPNLPTTRLRARIGDRHSNLLGFEEDYAGHMFIELRRPAGARILRGRVLDWLGRPVADALVSAYPNCTRSLASGEFVLTLWSEPRASSVVALTLGGTAVALPLEQDSEGRALDGSFFELRLPEHSSTLEGRVVRASGQPAAGALVWIDDPTLIHLDVEGPLGAETLCADARPSPWNGAVTDAGGGFRFEGLLEREYRLRAADPRTLARGEGRVRAGERLELELPAEAGLERVRGRVVDSLGGPVSGVAVRVALPGPAFAPKDGAHPCELRTDPVWSDAEGRFELGPCSREGTLLRLESEHILPAAFALDALQADVEVPLRVGRVSYLSVRLEEPWDRADAIEVLDATGSRSTPCVLEKCQEHASPRSPLVDGRSPVLTVPADSTTVLLLLRGREVGRIPIQQRPGELSIWVW